MKKFWRAKGRCHWPDKHASFHSRDHLMWNCEWCERMLSMFKIVAKDQDGKHFWGYSLDGKLWKLRGDESFKAGAWDTERRLEPK